MQNICIVGKMLQCIKISIEFIIQTTLQSSALTDQLCLLPYKKMLLFFHLPVSPLQSISSEGSTVLQSLLFLLTLPVLSLYYDQKVQGLCRCCGAAPSSCRDY